MRKAIPRWKENSSLGSRNHDDPHPAPRIPGASPDSTWIFIDEPGDEEEPVPSEDEPSSAPEGLEYLEDESSIIHDAAFFTLAPMDAAPKIG